MATASQPPVNLSAPPTSRASGHKSRHVADLSNVPVLGRTTLISQIQRVAAQAPPTAKFPRLIAFLQFWKWLGPYLRTLLHKNAAYQTYLAPSTGIFPLTPKATEPQDTPIRLSIVADWGTGTLEAETVADNMLATDPHLTIHLGDIYYMGQTSEIEENCFGLTTNNYSGVDWPFGSAGSFALMGNHEMYSGGQPYFTQFLPKLGLRNPDRSVRDPQLASFFALESSHWIILGLDTGYHSGGFPLVADVPLLNSLPFLDIDARLDDKLLAWLDQTLKTLEPAGAPQKSLLLLSHHQPFSTFEKAFPKAAAQLAKFPQLLNREVVWLYGHEHRLTLYNPQSLPGGLKVHPRCIGHGGMPVSVSTLSQSTPSILFYDPRAHSIDDQDTSTLVGYNGHVTATLDGANLTIAYRDIQQNNVLLTETFSPAANGVLTHTWTPPAPGGLISGTFVAAQH